MPYIKQTWADEDPNRPVSAARLNYIEAGIETVSQEIDSVSEEIETGGVTISDLDPIDVASDVDTLPLYDASSTATRKATLAQVRDRPPMPGPVIQGGAALVGVPGATFASITTRAMSVDQVRYYPFRVDAPIIASAVQFEVTTGPSADGNVRVGLYAANAALQPTGAPLFDHQVFVNTGAAGVQSQALASVPLGPGWYVLATNVDQAMTLRAFLGGPSFVAPAMGASGIVQLMYKARAYGPYPTPAAEWSAVTAGTGGFMHVLLLTWTVA